MNRGPDSPPPIHTTVLPALGTFLLSSLGVFLSVTLITPLALLVWLHRHHLHPTEAVFNPTVPVMFPPVLRIL